MGIRFKELSLTSVGRTEYGGGEFWMRRERSRNWKSIVVVVVVCLSSVIRTIIVFTRTMIHCSASRRGWSISEGGRGISAVQIREMANRGSNYRTVWLKGGGH